MSSISEHIPHHCPNFPDQRDTSLETRADSVEQPNPAASPADKSATPHPPHLAQHEHAHHHPTPASQTQHETLGSAVPADSTQSTFSANCIPPTPTDSRPDSRSSARSSSASTATNTERKRPLSPSNAEFDVTLRTSRAPPHHISTKASGVTPRLLTTSVVSKILAPRTPAVTSTQSQLSAKGMGLSNITPQTAADMLRNSILNRYVVFFPRACSAYLPVWGRMKYEDPSHQTIPAISVASQAPAAFAYRCITHEREHEWGARRVLKICRPAFAHICAH